MTTRPDDGLIISKTIPETVAANSVFDADRIIDGLKKMEDGLKRLNGAIGAIEIAALPDYSPEFQPIRDTSRLPEDSDFTSTPYSNAVFVYDTLEFGPNDANSVYQNDYTLEVTVGNNEILSLPFTSADAGITAMQNLTLNIVAGQEELGVWWLSPQPGGPTIKLNSYIYDRALGGSISLAGESYYIESSNAMEANNQVFYNTGEIRPGWPYWINFAMAPDHGLFSANGKLKVGVEVCSSSLQTTILIQGNTVSWSE